MRPIDADALIDFLDVGHLRHPSDLCFSEVDVANLLLHAPTLSPDDVRGVVHCKECKHTERDGSDDPEIYCKIWDRWEMPEDGFCYKGARVKGTED